MDPGDTLGKAHEICLQHIDVPVGEDQEEVASTEDDFLEDREQVLGEAELVEVALAVDQGELCQSWKGSGGVPKDGAIDWHGGCERRAEMRDNLGQRTT